MSLSHFIKSKLESLTGYYIHKKNDLPVGASLKVDIDYKLKNIKLNTIFDVGANFGQTAIQYSNDYPNSKIFAFEPIKNTYNILVEKTKLFPNITCKHLALGDSKSELEISIFDEKDSELNSLVSSNMNLDKNCKKEIIKVDTIDNFLMDNKIEHIDLLKIDTEGFEINVLNGAENTLKNNKIKLVFLEVGLDSEINNRHLNMIDIHQYLNKKNFTFIGYYDTAYWQISSRFHYANALYVNSSYL